MRWRWRERQSEKTANKVQYKFNKKKEKKKAVGFLFATISRKQKLFYENKSCWRKKEHKREKK